MNQTFNIDIYTYRQLVEGCLEKLYDIIKKAIQLYIDSQIEKTTNQTAIEDLKKNYNKDLLGMLTFFITNYDSIIVFYNLGDRRLIRSRLFELKQARNDYAHNRNYTEIRDVTRIYDTCLYLFEDLGMGSEYDTFKQINYIRGLLIMKEAQQIYNSLNNNSNNQPQNIQDFIPSHNHLQNNNEHYNQNSNNINTNNNYRNNNNVINNNNNNFNGNNNNINNNYGNDNQYGNDYDNYY